MNDKEILTTEIVAEYQLKAKELQCLDNQAIGKRRALMLELVERCGVTELEATNILNGYHVADYIRIYEILSGKGIPNVSEKTKEKNRILLEQLAELESQLSDLQDISDD